MGREGGGEDGRGVGKGVGYDTMVMGENLVPETMKSMRVEAAF